MSALRLRRYRPVAVLMLVLHLGACTTWRPVTVSPRQFDEEEQPDRVRVWQDERATELRNPVIEGDILTTTVPTEPPVGIALTDIASMEARGFALNRTILMVLIPAGLFVAAGLSYSPIEPSAGCTSFQGGGPKWI